MHIYEPNEWCEASGSAALGSGCVDAQALPGKKFADANYATRISQTVVEALAVLGQTAPSSSFSLFRIARRRTQLGGPNVPHRPETDSL
jgi:hypothetical protein